MKQLEELRQLKETIDRLKENKVRLETSLQQMEEVKVQILQEAQDLGVDPKQLATCISDLELDIQTQLQAIKHKLDGYSFPI